MPEEIKEITITMEEFKRLRRMEEEVRTFVNRVERGEIRSKRTYAAFKELLK